MPISEQTEQANKMSWQKASGLQSFCKQKRFTIGLKQCRSLVRLFPDAIERIRSGERPKQVGEKMSDPSSWIWEPAQTPGYAPMELPGDKPPSTSFHYTPPLPTDEPDEPPAPTPKHLTAHEFLELARLAGFDFAMEVKRKSLSA